VLQVPHFNIILRTPRFSVTFPRFYAHIYTDRLFIRNVFGEGSEMESKESEKMRQELESFLNSSLKQPEDAWPVKHLDLLKLETQNKKDQDVFVHDASVRR
jgi:hypothetical protein